MRQAGSQARQKGDLQMIKVYVVYMDAYEDADEFYLETEDKNEAYAAYAEKLKTFDPEKHLCLDLTVEDPTEYRPRLFTLESHREI